MCVANIPSGLPTNSKPKNQDATVLHAAWTAAASAYHKFLLEAALSPLSLGMGVCEELALKDVGWECDEQRVLRYESHCTGTTVPSQAPPDSVETTTQQYLSSNYCISTNVA
jgi:hypothetical protein